MSLFFLPLRLIASKAEVGVEKRLYYALEKYITGVWIEHRIFPNYVLAVFSVHDINFLNMTTKIVVETPLDLISYPPRYRVHDAAQAFSYLKTHTRHATFYSKFYYKTSEDRLLIARHIQ